MKSLMKIISILLVCIASSATANASEQPLSWTLTATRVEGTRYEIKATGTFSDSSWHIYDLTDNGSGGPCRTTFSIAGEGLTPIGEPRIVTPVKREFDEIFAMEIGVTEGDVTIVHTVELQDVAASEATVALEWQCCNSTSCLPPEEYTGTLTLGSVSPASSTSAEESSSNGLWAMIVEAVLWGLAMLLTPCVFPMVPMTVSFFLKGSQNKVQSRISAALYGIFIVLLYTVPICIIIGLTRLLGGGSVTADIFNWLSTHWLPNILFFIIFMAFAASFFGAFEITLPSGWVNSSDSKSGKKSVGGIFFLALTLVLVSFSCTGPIVGTVLIKSTQGEFWAPMVTMLAFSTAFALPFAIFALFPALLKRIPKSGGWLGSVKVVLGFIELALGLKFLSTADQTYHWHLLDREIYLAIWIVIFTLLGLYLLGKIRFKGDTPLEHLSVLRLALSIAVFSFVVYMIPGMWGAPLKGISGYLPPITTQDFVADRFHNVADPATTEARAAQQRRYSDFLEMPYGIEAFYDYEEARAYAVKCGKPLFVDFTGHGCVNCREMETRVWSDPRVVRMLREDFVVCALFADDKTVVEPEYHVTSEDGRVLRTLGRINSHFAMKKFGVNAQPYYTILNPETEEPKVPSRGYNLDVEAYVKFLEKGLE